MKLGNFIELITTYTGIKWIVKNELLLTSSPFDKEKCIEIVRTMGLFYCKDKAKKKDKSCIWFVNLKYFD